MLEKPKPPRLKPEEVRKQLLEDMKNTVISSYQPWEDALLKECIGKLSAAQIARRLQRSPDSVKGRANRLGINTGPISYRRVPIKKK